MQTTEHNKRCQVYLHPAAATSKASIEAIQRRTGLLIITSLKQRQAQLNHADSSAPWGGDAA
jgi:hypothetical protein